MIGRLAIVALAVGLAGCAGLEPAGRNARGGPSPTATASTPAPTPTYVPQVALPPPQATAPAPQATTAPQQRPALAVPPSQQTAPVAATPPPVRTQPTAPPVAAPRVTVPTPAPSQPARALSPDDDIVVPGQVQTQVPAPAGDPRSNEERRADVRSWDQCITQVQGAFDGDPMSAQLTTPEEYCAQSLGMADRTSVPFSRRQRR